LEGKKKEGGKEKGEEGLPPYIDCRRTSRCDNRFQKARRQFTLADGEGRKAKGLKRDRKRKEYRDFW